MSGCSICGTQNGCRCVTAGAKELFSKMPVVCMCKLATHPKCSLHAAAPEMLEALKKAKKTIYDLSVESLIPTGEGCQLVVNGEPARVLYQIDDIISKVEGKKTL